MSPHEVNHLDSDTNNMNQENSAELPSPSPNAKSKSLLPSEDDSSINAVSSVPVEETPSVAPSPDSGFGVVESNVSNENYDQKASEVELSPDDDKGDEKDTSAVSGMPDSDQIEDDSKDDDVISKNCTDEESNVSSENDIQNMSKGETDASAISGMPDSEIIEDDSNDNNVISSEESNVSNENDAQKISQVELSSIDDKNNEIDTSAVSGMHDSDAVEGDSNDDNLISSNCAEKESKVSNEKDAQKMSQVELSPDDDKNVEIDASAVSAMPDADAVEDHSNDDDVSSSNCTDEESKVSNEKDAQKMSQVEPTPDDEIDASTVSGMSDSDPNEDASNNDVSSSSCTDEESEDDEVDEGGSPHTTPSDSAAGKEMPDGDSNDDMYKLLAFSKNRIAEEKKNSDDARAAKADELEKSSTQSTSEEDDDEEGTSEDDSSEVSSEGESSGVSSDDESSQESSSEPSSSETTSSEPSSTEVSEEEEEGTVKRAVTVSAPAKASSVAAAEDSATKRRDSNADLYALLNYSKKRIERGSAAPKPKPKPKVSTSPASKVVASKAVTPKQEVAPKANEFVPIKDENEMDETTNQHSKELPTDEEIDETEEEGSFLNGTYAAYPPPVLPTCSSLESPQKPEEPEQEQEQEEEEHLEEDYDQDYDDDSVPWSDDEEEELEDLPWDDDDEEDAAAVRAAAERARSYGAALLSIAEAQPAVADPSPQNAKPPQKTPPKSLLGGALSLRNLVSKSKPPPAVTPAKSESRRESLSKQLEFAKQTSQRAAAVAASNSSTGSPAPTPSFVTPIKKSSPSRDVERKSFAVPKIFANAPTMTADSAFAKIEKVTSPRLFTPITPNKASREKRLNPPPPPAPRPSSPTIEGESPTTQKILEAMLAAEEAAKSGVDRFCSRTYIERSMNSLKENVNITSAKMKEKASVASKKASITSAKMKEQASRASKTASIRSEQMKEKASRHSQRFSNSMKEFKETVSKIDQIPVGR